MAAHICNPSAMEAEAGGSEVVKGVGGGTEEMAQQLRESTVLLKDLSSVPRIHTGRLTTACDSATPRRPLAS